MIRLMAFIKWKQASRIPFPTWMRLLADYYLNWHFHKPWTLTEAKHQLYILFRNKHPWFYNRRKEGSDE